MRKWIKLGKLFLSFTLAVVFLFGLVHTAEADFGDYGGSSDYGDSGSDWGSDWSSGGSGSYSGSSGSFGVPGMIFTSIGFYFLVIRPMMKGSKGSTTQKAHPPGAARTTGLRPLSDIYNTDPNFSEAGITQRLSNLYVQMQNCWQAKDLLTLRGDFTDQQYAQFDRQLQRYRAEAQTNIIERIAILGVDLRGIKQDDRNDILVANMRTRIVDYVIDDKTGSVIRGSNTAEKFMEYEWTLIRPRGSQTKQQSADEAFICPNCSAPININQSAQCPYCGSIVTKTDYDWVISEIKGLSQRTS